MPDAEPTDRRPYARGFRLTVTYGTDPADTRTYDGAQFPSGRVMTDHRDTGLFVAYATIEDLQADLPEAVIDWDTPAADTSPAPTTSTPDQE